VDELMYTMQQAEQLAKGFLREQSASSECELALFEEDEYRGEKGDFFYFGFQGAKYIATRNDDDFLYGPTCISVHRLTGECGLLSIREMLSSDPFDRRSR
jgi:hypothetical protein